MAGADPYIVGKAAWAYATVTARNQVTLGAMERALDALAQHQGRKSLILVSEGFIHDSELEEFRRIAHRLATREHRDLLPEQPAAWAVPSSLDEVPGVRVGRGSWPPSSPTSPQNSGGSVSLAQDSGGFTIRDSSEFATGLQAHR